MRIVPALLLLGLCLMQTACPKWSVNYGELAQALREFGIGETVFDRQDPLLQQRAILVQGHITFASAQGAIDKLFYLAHVDADTPIRLYLNARGGELGAIFAIAHTMEHLTPPVEVIVTGWCFSGATALVASATGKRYAHRHAIFGLHAGSGTPEDLVRRGNELFERLLREKTQLPAAWFPLGKELRFFSAQEALEYGVVDGILERASRIRQ